MFQFSNKNSKDRYNARGQLGKCQSSQQLSLLDESDDSKGHDDPREERDWVGSTTAGNVLAATGGTGIVGRRSRGGRGGNSGKGPFGSSGGLAGSADTRVRAALVLTTSRSEDGGGVLAVDRGGREDAWRRTRILAAGDRRGRSRGGRSLDAEAAAAAAAGISDVPGLDVGRAAGTAGGDGVGVGHSDGGGLGAVSKLVDGSF